MNVLFRTWAVFVVAAKRLLSRWWLALATAAGLVASVALTMSVPLYADAVYHRVFREELWGGQGGGVEATRSARPPFAFMFRYIGAFSGSVEWEDVQQIDAYMSGPAASDLGLPRRSLVRYFESERFQLFPEKGTVYTDYRKRLSWVSFGSASDLENHITILEGGFPAVAPPSQDSTIEVLVSEPLALKLGLQTGDTYTAFGRLTTRVGKQTTQIPVRIAGIWRATDPGEEFWFYGPMAFEDTLFVPEETFLGRLSPYLGDDFYECVWYLVMDGSDVHARDALSLLARINGVWQRAAALLPETRLDVSPVDALRRYWWSSRLLTVLLYAFSVPIVGLVLVFIGLVGRLSVSRQRNEIAVLRSRGATAIQIVGIGVLEGLLLGAGALIVGSPAGAAIARVIGRTRSFLDFSAVSDLRVEMTKETFYFGLAAVALALLAQVLPTIGAARHTIVTYKQERARALRAPWWQRAWLDVLLLIPFVYGTYLLRQQGAIVLPVAGGAVVSDPFQNPLLFLMPALGILALTLFLLRVLPFIMAGVAWIASHMNGVGVLLAVRHLSRTPGFYAAPLVLLVLTLGLSAYIASLAQTLDRHLHDRTYYELGADMGLAERGQDLEGLLGAAFGESTEQEDERPGPRWYFLPVFEHLKVPGVRAAARVGRYDAASRLSGRSQTGVFMGIDRTDFPQAAYWRRDFAPATLGALMNELAVESNAVLVPRSFMGRHALRKGDIFRLTVYIAYDRFQELDLKVAGGFDLFPTWYPEDGPLFVGNLDHLFERVGGQFPYDVWLEADEDVDHDRIVEDVRDLGMHVIRWEAPLLMIAEEETNPERQGLFGLLSVGFAAAALLTVLGFLLYALFSFRRRFIELGILRAVGLSSGQMIAFLAWELAFLILVGLGAGTGLGVWVSRLFIPYLQVGADASANIPPFAVEIAWPAVFRIYVLFGALFVVALGVLTTLLLRMKVFQAVKLGETV